ncbi:MAG TPA: alpha/beta hydrolase [Longimicrobiaceae bacterium]|nr:alpha/beta hydrolase [Longimicrobiaceae bacterium]
MEPILSHTRVAAAGRTPARWMLVLHGIYGAGRNWGSVARRLVEARPEWGAVLVDLRCHGGSQGFAGPHTLAAAADDVRRLAEHLDAGVEAVLGHSFGGKVALLHAQRAPAGLRQVWVMDSTPAARPPEGSAWEMLAAVRALPESFASRAEAVEGLVRQGYPEGLGQWMAINLEPADGGYRWRLDFDAAEEMLRDFFRTDAWAVVENPPPGVELHFVKATRSATLDPASEARLEAAARGGRVFLHRLEGGHWINADNPDGVLELLARTLP